MGGRSNRRGPFDLRIHSLMLPNSSPGVRLQRCLRVGKSAFIRDVVRRGSFAPARASRCAVSGQESNLHTSATLAVLQVPMASHTWQESNPQSSVLETVTPPLAQAYAPQLITERGNSEAPRANRLNGKGGSTLGNPRQPCAGQEGDCRYKTAPTPHPESALRELFHLQLPS